MSAQRESLSIQDVSSWRHDAGEGARVFQQSVEQFKMKIEVSSQNV